MHIEIAAKSDMGRERSCNEDSFLALKTRNVFAVCDGMGGHQAGDFASQTAVKVLDYWLNERIDVDITEIVSDVDQPISPFGKRLIAAVRLANRHIYNIALNSPQKSGMGTTLVLIGFEDSQAYILHVGDSRVYGFSDENLEQLTRDHSWVNELLEDSEISEKEAESFDHKNVITRALGTKSVVKIDIRCQPIINGSQFLLCSDGLSGPVKDEQIAEIIRRNYTSPKNAVSSLIEAANRNGGPDNITAVFLSVNDLVQSNGEPCNLDVVTLPEEPEYIQKIEDKLLNKHFGGQVTSSKTKLIKSAAVGTPLIILIFFLLFFFNNQAQKKNKKGDRISAAPSVVNTQPQISRKKELNQTGKIVFIWFNVDKRRKSFVYVDGKMRGTVEDFRIDGLDLAPGKHSVVIKLRGKTLFRKVILLKVNTVESIDLEEIVK